MVTVTKPTWTGYEKGWSDPAYLAAVRQYELDLAAQQQQQREWNLKQQMLQQQQQSQQQAMSTGTSSNTASRYSVVQTNPDMGSSGRMTDAWIRDNSTGELIKKFAGDLGSNLQSATDAAKAWASYQNQGGVGGTTGTTGGMVGSGQMSTGTTPQLTAEQKAANEAAYNLSRQNLEDEYFKLSQGVINRANRQNMFGSSVINEDQGQVQQGFARGLADLENRRQMGMFTTQGQDISNQAALQNMAVQQQQLALQQRQQQQNEQNNLMKLMFGI